jgi:glycosyltransferase involved in cell wall biosynthesis
VTGRLVPEGDVAALARAIKGLLADDTGRRALGLRAVNWARRFTWPAVGRSLAELYAELLPTAGGVAAGASRCRFQL